MEWIILGSFKIHHFRPLIEGNVADASNNALGPSKLNEHLIDTFSQVIALGNYPTVACQVVRIHISTYRLWMRRGEDAVDDSSPYRQFYLRVKEAEAISEGYAVEKWRKHMGTNYKAARDFLARRFSSRWGPTYKITIEVEKELTRLMEKLAEKLPPELYQQVIVALADAQEDLSNEVDDEEQYIDLTPSTEAQL